jgi:hypothetical protein
MLKNEKCGVRVGLTGINKIPYSVNLGMKIYIGCGLFK